MEYKIIPMGEGTWRIEDGHVGFFLLVGTKRALLIDSGISVCNAKEIAQSLTDLPVELLNTHADMDHVRSNEEFDAFYMHPEEEANYRRGGRKGTLLPVVDGDVLDLGERELKVIHLPGHTPGSIAILDVKNRVLISGDPIQEHGRIFMFGEHRNMPAYVESLKRLVQFADTFDEIWPSHADIPIKPEVIPKLIAGAEAILAGEVPGVPMEMHGRQIHLYDLGFTAFLCD